MEFRQVLREELDKLFEQDEAFCLLDADLSKPNGTAPLYKKYPNRCFNVGIAEANMVSVAAGLSAYGMKPVAVSFAPFATRRCYDQIAISVAYAKQNVKIVGTDPGITAELNGGTHMPFEDLALMTAIPNMVVYDAADEYSFRQALKFLLPYEGNVYIRVPRKSRPAVFDETYEYHPFKADVVTEGKDITIIACGTMVYEAKQAVEILKEQGISAELINVNTIKPLDSETILASLKKTGRAVTCENHNVNGGLYAAVASLTASKLPTPVLPVAVMDQFGQVGKYNDLLKAYNLTGNDIANKCKELINKEN